MNTKISNQYSWLETLPDAPLMIKEALRIGKLNTNEIPGTKSNPEIMKLAEIAGVKHIYKNDDIAWCAVAQSAICLLANKELPFTGYDRLRAKSFLHFGVQVKEPMLGDIMVFSRTGGGHVGMYIGEDKGYYHIAGGNQSNQFNITRIVKSRLTAVRRPKYRVMPKSVKKYYLEPLGKISQNEA